MKKNLLIALVLLCSCTASKVSVPTSFQQQSTRLPVKGLNGWMVNQKLSFGPYITSSVKRGWDFGSSFQFTKFRVSPEEFVLRVFNINTDKRNIKERNRFQYTLESGNDVTEIYATEKFTENQLVYRSNNPLLGQVSQTLRYEYAFTAAILPLTGNKKDPWSLVLMNRYDAARDTAKRIFDRPYVEEEGYATNGTETIAIRPLRLEKVVTKKGKELKALGGRILTGYELQWDDGVVAVIDIFDNSIWIQNELDAADKLMISSVASAILLKRTQDVQKSYF